MIGYYQERRYLSHGDNPDYQGWFVLTWFVFKGYHSLVGMVREGVA